MSKDKKDKKNRSEEAKKQKLEPKNINATKKSVFEYDKNEPSDS
jgi:hypothetical protein